MGVGKAVQCGSPAHSPQSADSAREPYCDVANGDEFVIFPWQFHMRHLQEPSGLGHERVPKGA